MIKNQIIKQLEKISPKSKKINFLSFIYLGAIALAFSIYGTNPIFYLLFFVLSFLFIFPDQDFLGLALIIVLTMIFERHFTLSGIVIGEENYKFYLIDIIIILTFLSLIIKNKFKNNNKLTFDWPEKILLIFLISTLIYFIRSVFDINADLAVAFSSLKNYFFYPLLYFITIYVLSDKERIIKLISLILFTAIGLIIFIFIGLMNGSGLWTEFTPLSTGGTRYLAGTHAFYMMLAVIMSLPLLVYNKINRPLFILSIIAIWSIGIQLSLMRHLWLSLGFSVVLIFLLINSSAKKIFIDYAIKTSLLFLSLMTILILIFNLTYFNNSTGKIQSTFNNINERFFSTTNLSDDSSASWRQDVWKQAYKKWAKNPILGIGFGHSILIDKGDWQNFEEIRNIHNSPLSITVQMGIINIVIFLSFIILIVFSTYKNINKNREFEPYLIGGIAVVFAFLISSLFQPYLETNLMSIWLWMFLGILRAITLINEKNENTSS